MTDTEKITLINFALEYIASMWSRFFAPVTLERTLEIEGHRVRVTVGYERKRETELDALLSESHGAHD